MLSISIEVCSRGGKRVLARLMKGDLKILTPPPLSDGWLPGPSTSTVYLLTKIALRQKSSLSEPGSAQGFLLGASFFSPEDFLKFIFLYRSFSLPLSPLA
ncbi:hypothetical protein GJAV_G00105810 [Gymnothorax javanicus]|nr:hypothetical protein GJAV_G00105810 [Gymnothorax javanicus]